MANHTASIEQRLQDRRSDISFICPYQLGLKQGKRVATRRADSKAAYVDSYSWQLVFCCLAIVLLSASDAFLTLNILANGGVELNGLMAILIDDSTQKFVLFKLSLTSLAAIFLVIHHDLEIFAGFRCKHILYLILLGYFFLIGYELVLLWLIGNGG
jgi:hypothetical protein